METYDPRVARRVWDRVWAQPEQDREGLGAFILREGQTAADCTKLARRCPEAKSLAEETGKILACLRGLQQLQGGRRPAPISTKNREEPVKTVLQRCIFQCLKAVQIYESRSRDPEFGCIYAQLAQTKEKHCRLLLELLGRLEEK